MDFQQHFTKLLENENLTKGKQKPLLKENETGFMTNVMHRTQYNQTFSFDAKISKG